MKEIPLSLRTRLAEISDRLAELHETMDMLGRADEHGRRYGASIDALYRESCELHDELRRARAWRDSQRG